MMVVNASAAKPKTQWLDYSLIMTSSAERVDQKPKTEGNGTEEDKYVGQSYVQMVIQGIMDLDRYASMNVCEESGLDQVTKINVPNCQSNHLAFSPASSRRLVALVLPDVVGSPGSMDRLLPLLAG